MDLFRKGVHPLEVDYLTTSQNLADTRIKAYVERPASHAERWSDHAPVAAEFDCDTN
ncbi:hypothetical protein [Kitasatospora sp. NPDC058190]|uniref:hypothetical protein n=1 Tax=Kitasatospora sp. NPDC058190 TaxID=3346371 RepID=UPI0036DE946A